jgi:hypothetical protein
MKTTTDEAWLRAFSYLRLATRYAKVLHPSEPDDAALEAVYTLAARDRMYDPKRGFYFAFAKSVLWSALLQRPRWAAGARIPAHCDSKAPKTRARIRRFCHFTVSLSDDLRSGEPVSVLVSAPEHNLAALVDWRRGHARALALAKTKGTKAALAVLEGGSMTDEAEKCGLTRQAVHQALRRLARRADFHYEDEPTRK